MGGLFSSRTLYASSLGYSLKEAEKHIYIIPPKNTVMGQSADGEEQELEQRKWQMFTRLARQK